MSEISLPVVTPAPAAVPMPVAPSVEVAAPPAQLRPSHVAGGGLGGMVSALIVVALAHYHVHVSGVDAAILGSSFLSAGVGIGHVVGEVGIFGAFKRLMVGRS